MRPKGTVCRVMELLLFNRTLVACGHTRTLANPRTRRGKIHGISPAIHACASAAFSWGKYLIVAVVKGFQNIAIHCSHFFSPIIAGAAMSLSSVSVIGNALRLRKATL